MYSIALLIIFERIIYAYFDLWYCVGRYRVFLSEPFCCNETDSVRDRCCSLHVYFSVDSLEYLYKGGRISSTKAAVGTLLNIKPILTIEDGLVKQKSQVRGSKKLIPSLIQMQIDDIGNDFSNIDIEKLQEILRNDGVVLHESDL